MKKIQILLKIFLLPLDFIFCFFAFIIAYTFRARTTSFFSHNLLSGDIPELKTYLSFVFFVCFLLLLVFAVAGLYSLKQQKRGVEKIPHIFFCIVVWIFLMSSYFFWGRTFFFSRLVLLLGSVLTFVFVVLTRIIFDWIKDYGVFYNVFQKNVILVGMSKLNTTIINNIKKGGEYKITKTFDTEELIHLSKIKSYITNNTIFEIIHTDVGRDKNFDLKILDFCQIQNITYRFIPNIFTLHKTNIETRTLSGIPIIELKPTPLDGWGKIAKRLFDIGFSSIALLLFTPLFLIISIAIKVTSKGPIFVQLERIRCNNIFKILKFRSMVQDAHKLKKDLLNKNERDDGPLFKMEKDPRITKIGRFLRKSRIDELPQFINVLKGEMSIVGPRPHEPGEVAKYEKHHRKLLAIKPGITGMAQVHGASDLPFEEEVRLDVYYIENWNLWKDVEIIIRTVFVVLTGKGAA